MSWAPGDLALCVTEEPWESLTDEAVGPGPTRGALIVVYDTTTFADLVMLQFAQWPDFFQADGFRKIEPLDEAQRLRTEVERHAEDSLAALRSRELAK